MQLIIRVASSASLALLAAVVAALLGSLGVIWVVAVAALCVTAIIGAFVVDRRRAKRLKQHEATAAHNRNLEKLERQVRSRDMVTRYVERVQLAVIEDLKRQRGPG